MLNYSNNLASITFNRPEKRNAFSSDMLRQLSDALDELEHRNDHSVLVLRGSNSHFCSGWDFNEFEKMRSKGQKSLQNEFHEHLGILNKLERHSKLVVALIEGSVAGFGFSLAARCDITLGASDCLFALPEIKLGIVPAIVMIDLHRLVTPKIAMDWLASGRVISPEEALHHGLLSRIIPPNVSFEEAIENTLKEFSEKSPLVIEKIKSTLHEFASCSQFETEKLASKVAADSIFDSTAAEGLAAFKEKRKPDWPR